MSADKPAPRVVAECWTCCGATGHISKPHEAQTLCVPRRLEGNYLQREHRAAGHDVREVSND